MVKIQTISLNVSDSQKEFLDSIDNYSDWIRDAIELKRGAKEKSLIEYEVEEDSHRQALYIIEQKKYALIEKKLAEKEKLILSEIEELERKKAEKETKDNLTRTKFAFLDNYEEVKNITFEQLKDRNFLMAFQEKLIKDGQRVGTWDIRYFCDLKLFGTFDPARYYPVKK